MSFCESEALGKSLSTEKETENSEIKELPQEDNIDLVINSLKMTEFEKELLNLKSNIVFIINHLSDLDASQVIFEKFMKFFIIL